MGLGGGRQQTEQNGGGESLIGDGPFSGDEPSLYPPQAAAHFLLVMSTSQLTDGLVTFYIILIYSRLVFLFCILCCLDVRHTIIF